MKALSARVAKRRAARGEQSPDESATGAQESTVVAADRWHPQRTDVTARAASPPPTCPAEANESVQTAQLTSLGNDRVGPWTRGHE